MQLECSEQEREALNYERYHHPHPQVQRKMEVIWLKSLGKEIPEISQIAHVSITTVYRYLASYREGGIEKLKEVSCYRPQSDFVEHKAQIEAYFLDHPPATMKEAAQRLEELTGIKRSEPQVSQFLKSLGIKRRKVGMIPTKADSEKQAIFKQEQLEPVLEAAQQGEKKSTLSMPPILCWHPFSVISGLFAACLCKHLRDANASMSSVRSMRSHTNWLR